MTLEQRTAAEAEAANAKCLEAVDKISEVLGQLEPHRRVRVLLATIIISCPQAVTTEQVVQFFQAARLG